MKKYSEKIKTLFQLGDVNEAQTKKLYAAFNKNHIPELIELATDVSLLQGKKNDPETWAPVHAWHILANLKATDAIDQLIELFHILEHNHFVDEELPEIFAEFAGAALPSLEKYLKNANRSDDARISAAACIKEIGEAHPDVREKCIKILTEQLEKFEANSAELNAFLIWYLTDLQARKSFAVIKEAFERNCVDKTIVGELSNVEYQLNLTDKKPTVQIYAEESFKDESDQNSSQ